MRKILIRTSLAARNRANKHVPPRTRNTQHAYTRCTPYEHTWNAVVAGRIASLSFLSLSSLTLSLCLCPSLPRLSFGTFGKTKAAIGWRRLLGTMRAAGTLNAAVPEAGRMGGDPVRLRLGSNPRPRQS
jgi:hypothetical protein